MRVPKENRRAQSLQVNTRNEEEKRVDGYGPQKDLHRPCRDTDVLLCIGSEDVDTREMRRAEESQPHGGGEKNGDNNS